MIEVDVETERAWAGRIPSLPQVVSEIGGAAVLFVY